MGEEARAVIDWDTIANDWMDALVLIGVKYLTADGAFDRQEQFAGRLSVIDPQQGFGIALQGDRAGDMYWLPPDPSFFQSADPGDYRLRSTGEVISDPDLIVSATIQAGPDA